MGVALVILAGFATAFLRPAAEPPAPRPARLAVLVVFDQMRGDYLSRWETLFAEGGFRRLQTEGAWFQNCHYPYANSVTAAGHASLATGCSPRIHGIVGNEWYENAANRIVSCVATRRYHLGPTGDQNDPELRRPMAGGAPERLLAPTLADSLNNATGGSGKVVSLSFKDRSAVLPGGRKPDACCWFDNRAGRFVTSSYYGDRLPRWVEAFNDRHLADSWFDKTWTRLRADIDYERYSGPDDAPGEGFGIKGIGGERQGVAFPHSMRLGLPKPGRSYYDAMYDSPFGNDLLLELAFAGIAGEQLGQHARPDLL
ncbi:MAG: alkaline phosphatase family protein, partial [Candidatus Acidiferrum sp.]